LKRILEAMRRAGVIGINQRNSRYTLRCNPRRLYPLVDDKLRTKRLCEAAGIPTPQLLAVATHPFEVKSLPRRLADQERFVLKPSHGAMGNGILVVTGRTLDGGFSRAGGRTFDEVALLYHAASIISGLYALAGQPDSAMVEELLVTHPELAEISTDGVPDVRIIVYRGIPVMAMTRLPTSRSGGRANLHQGAVGVGIDLVSGESTNAVLENRPVRRHPDSGKLLLGRRIPHFDRAVETAVRATDQTGLGYVGADIVVDARLGPVVLELNARPGLAVQVANRAGLLPRLSAVDASFHPERGIDERIALGREIASASRGGRSEVYVL
jgi:alpha-L-glutamate ligase-like protein